MPSTHRPPDTTCPAHAEAQVAACARRAMDDWLAHLAHERGAAQKTVEAYGRDLGQLLTFLAHHYGRALPLDDLAALDA
jgi:integrase/recombinase XerC